ncbi:hypothetical protein DXG03_005942 [Asterophora parasitica]|uniref:Uncharacterized protein n=1 Tax=Asterophora parasitica TaxID=117018 RepID=A0A9P7G198_9AGAR|nr:hypothetical protein DXG03_005942 [Asterophora parasitica]
MTSTKLGNDFLRVLKLDVLGNNWVIYKDCFLWSVNAHGLLDHLDGSAAEPVNPLPNCAQSPLSQANTLLDTKWKKEVKTWKQGEAIIKQQIAGTIPDSLFMKI